MNTYYYTLFPHYFYSSPLQCSCFHPLFTIVILPSIFNDCFRSVFITISPLFLMPQVGREKAQLAALKASLDQTERDKKSKDGSSGGAGIENYKAPKTKGNNVYHIYNTYICLYIYMYFIHVITENYNAAKTKSNQRDCSHDSLYYFFYLAYLPF